MSNCCLLLDDAGDGVLLLIGARHQSADDAVQQTQRLLLSVQNFRVGFTVVAAAATFVYRQFVILARLQHKLADETVSNLSRTNENDLNYITFQM